MSRTGVRVVDMTARIGGLAIGQTGATLSTTEFRQAIALSTTPGMPTIDWVRPPYPNADLEAADGPAALLVILGPGSVHGALDLLRRAWAADLPAVADLPSRKGDNPVADRAAERQRANVRTRHLHAE